ncbi:MAG: carboxypeptidase regulatory-like domain-containing protein [Bryobacteraceae bacterium]
MWTRKLIQPGRWLLLVLFLCAGVCYAQFSGSIQGVVQDPTGAVVPNAAVRLLNVNTQISAETKSDGAGNYTFVSLAPGSYEVTVEAAGFNKSTVKLDLGANQILNVPVSITLATAASTVAVTAEAPILNTAESRNEMTLETAAVAELPVPGRNMVTLATMAPGASGLGTVGGGQPGVGGTPGSGVDNYSTETQVDASANGEGQMSNMYIVDGLDVTSGIRQGVLNLTPNPDSVQETSIEVNTFSSQYTRADGLSMIMTTKSGTDQFHGLAADYFNYQSMFAGTEFAHNYPPFHSNNMSGAIGGPVIPHHQFYFFFAVEPLRESSSTGNESVTFADPAFTAWAQANYPGTVGASLLAKYLPTKITGVSVSETAAQMFPANSLTPCGSAASNNLPCSLAMIDQGGFNGTNFRNGTQYFARLDKYWQNDRIYGSVYRTLLNYGSASPMPQFSAANNNWEYAMQVNYTHTFSPTTLNEAIFGVSRVEGDLGSGASTYTVPDVNVSGINVDSGQAFGVGFAQGDFIQKNFHWQDVLSHVHGAHTLKFGYQGWWGADVEPFEGPTSTPEIYFNNLLTLAQDSPSREGAGGQFGSGLMYDPTTGQPLQWSWNAASSTWGLFAEDTWKATRNLTLTLGLRWDDSGNPYSRDATTVFGNFYLGPGQTYDQQVANGFVKATHNALNHAVTNLLSPRLGFAWDPNGKSDWVLRGGVGMYNNWLTQANVQEEFRGAPPGGVEPVFYAGTATPPVFGLGTSDKQPFGFPYPPFPAGLNSQGGSTLIPFSIGGINPNLESPRADIWALTLERRISSRYVASVGYSGSHSYNIVGNNNAAGDVSYGVDINSFAGDIIANDSNGVYAPTRLNHSFGGILYADNNRYGNYESLVFDFRGKFSRGFFDASYTRSSSKDDAGYYPSSQNPGQYYGPSPWDVPNRFSLSFNYSLQGLNHGKGAIGQVTGGWGLSGVSIYQSGYPLTVINTNGPAYLMDATGHYIGYAAGSGDYNADGDNLDYPNATGYAQGTSRQDFLHGIFTAGQFTNPAFGSEGSEKSQGFRGPNFAETDVAVYKDTRIWERVNLQLRFEFYNIFNRANLTSMDTNPEDSRFGEATGQQLPRWMQVGAKITF